MKLINLICPNCSSALQINADKSVAFCEYCGAKILIDDEVQHFQFDNAYKSGYEFEKGRQAAMEPLNAQFVLKRVKAFYLCAVKLEIFVDGMPIATLKNGQSVSKVLSVGDHYLKILDITNGNKVCFSNTIRVLPGGVAYSFHASYHIKLINETSKREKTDYLSYPQEINLKDIDDKITSKPVINKILKIILYVCVGFLLLFFIFIFMFLNE